MYTSTSSAADERVYCPECHRATEVVLDHATGDTICTECALVLDAHYIDECSEWRNFADDGGGDDRDPSRVGASGDPFLNAKLSTVIVYSNKPSATGVAANALPRMSVRDADASAASENTLVDGFRGIADMADRLGLVATIRDLAKETFKKLYDAKGSPRGRKRDAVYAACLYIACRNLGMPRTYKELASEDGQVMDIGVVSASDYLRRFCSRLGLGNQEVRDAKEAVRKVEEGLDVRRNPESVAAAIIYMVVQRAGAGRSVKDVSVATGVAEGTIKEAHKDLTPHAQMLFG
ncbi:hypothetical protein ZWY2020_043609 [Hordeum vulgare]|nr:hypothetical protein ZWY2020_043609 [Hordeum vulgare]